MSLTETEERFEGKDSDEAQFRCGSGKERTAKGEIIGRLES